MSVVTAAFAVGRGQGTVPSAAAFDFVITLADVAAILVGLESVGAAQIAANGLAAYAFTLTIDPDFGASGEAGVGVGATIDPADRVENFGTETTFVANAFAFGAGLAIAAVVIGSASV